MSHEGLDSPEHHQIRFDYTHPVLGPSEGVASIPKKVKKPTLKDVTLHSAGLKGDLHVGAEDLSHEDHERFKQAALEHHQGMKKSESNQYREYQPFEVAIAVLNKTREIGRKRDLLTKGEGPNSAHNVEPGKMPSGNSRAENGAGHSVPEKEVAGAPREEMQTKLPQTPQEPKRDGKGPSDAVTKDPAPPSQQRSEAPHAEAAKQAADQAANAKFVKKYESKLKNFMAKREEKLKKREAGSV